MRSISYKLKYRKYAEALYEALNNDAFYRAMERTVDDHNQSRYFMLKYLDYSMRESEKYGELYIPDDHKYGVSIWSKPVSPELKSQKAREKKAFILNESGNNSLSTYTCITEFMSEKAESIVGSEFWYLSILGVLPQYQGKGLGTALITSVLAKTDTLGIPTYLETFTPRNRSFYSRLGYKETASFNEPTTKKEYFVMVREAPNA